MYKQKTTTVTKSNQSSGNLEKKNKTKDYVMYYN